jgi:hypothetical protein
MDRVNGFAAVQHRQLIEVPLGLLRLRYVNACGKRLPRSPENGQK